MADGCSGHEAGRRLCRRLSHPIPEPVPTCRQIPGGKTRFLPLKVYRIGQLKIIVTTPTPIVGVGPRDESQQAGIDSPDVDFVRLNKTGMDGYSFSRPLRNGNSLTINSLLKRFIFIWPPFFPGSPIARRFEPEPISSVLVYCALSVTVVKRKNHYRWTFFKQGR